MAYKQNTKSQTSGTRSGHGNQCPCAVCTDLGSVADSVSTPLGRQGGSVAGQSLQSGHTSQCRQAVGPGPNGSIGKRSQASARTQDSSSKRGKSPGPSAGPSAAQTLSSECLPPTQPERSQGTPPGPHVGTAGEPGSQGAGAVAAGRGGQNHAKAGKSRTNRSPSGTRGKAGKTCAAAGGGGKEIEVPRDGGQRPRPLCISRGQSFGLEDECDFDDTGDAMNDSEQQFYDQTVAEVCGREAAPYLPQASDKGPLAPAPMDPLGPWAVGKPDWTPLGGLTGTRPIVDRYTITRYSVPEWRQYNLETFERAAGDTNRANSVAFNARACISEVLSAAPKNQGEVTQRLQQRNTEVRRWLTELKKTHEELWREIMALGIEDDRLRRILCVLEDIHHLVGESLELRTARMDRDLTHDEVDQEMSKEFGLINEIKQLLQRTRGEIRQQLDSSKAAKHRLELDISDKEATARIDCANIQLSVRSPTILFHEGAARFMDHQSTPENWELFSRENMAISENEISKIRSLRALIERIVTDTCRDLLTQKGTTEDTLTKHITVIASIVEDLEDRLKWVLRSIVEAEKLIRDLKETLRKLDFPMKKVQTRLHARQGRPRNENTRDCPQFALVDELKTLGEQSTAILAQLAPAEEALQTLLKTRSHLEKELQSKKKNLHIDRDRILRLRQSYPPAEAIMPHASSQCLPCR